MENVINTLPARVSPEAMQQGTPEGLKVGHLSIASDIFETFGNDSDNTKVQVVARWADALTCDQFAKECKDAQEIADKTDAACGFVAPKDAKGTEKYGPKRRLINSRMSEAKALFGVYKINPDVLKEKGYWAAIQAAREFLDSKGVKWDGTPRPSDEVKASRKLNKELSEADMAVRKDHPMEEGENYKEYVERIAPLVDEYREAMQVAKIVEKLKELGTEELVNMAIFEVIKSYGPDHMDLCAQQLHEEAEELRKA